MFACISSVPIDVGIWFCSEHTLLLSVVEKAVSVTTALTDVLTINPLSSTASDRLVLPQIQRPCCVRCESFLNPPASYPSHLRPP